MTNTPNPFAQWIAENVGETYGTCGEVTALMAVQFPELTRVRGHYFCLAWGQREHWWLKTATGEIVDPTAGQFPSKGRGVYTEWNEGDEEPTGKCMNCGDYCYREELCCCASCEQAVRADFV